MIQIRNLSMRLSSGGRELLVLNDITFEVPAKQFLAIMGPSGSGKSTLLGLIAGLDSPTSGAVRIHNRDITHLPEDQAAAFRLQHIGYVFQSFHLIPTLTALENVAVSQELAAHPKALTRAAELLRIVGVSDRTGHYPVQPSRGEPQRVSLARAFTYYPSGV